MEESDKNLLTRYCHGEVDALERLVDKYRRSLFGFILNMTEGRDDADDIFQEVWLRVIRKLGTYRHKNFFGWLVRIAHNVIIDRSRRRKHEFTLDKGREEGESPDQLIRSDDRGPLAELQASDLGRHVAEAVAGLPAEQKEVFIMRVQTGLSFKEIARIQKVSVNTALARMHYTLAKLRSMLKQDYEEITGQHEL